MSNDVKNSEVVNVDQKTLTDIMSIEDSDIFKFQKRQFDSKPFDLGKNDDGQEIKSFHIYHKINRQKLCKEFRMKFVSQAEKIYESSSVTAYMIEDVVMARYSNADQWLV